MAINDTPWTGSQDDKLYLQSGQFTSTLKTSRSTIPTDYVPTGIEWDGTNTLWSGFFNYKLYLTSGQFTSTIKTSQYFGGDPDRGLFDISWDGINTPCIKDKLALVSGQFSSIVKTSRNIDSIDPDPIGISWDGFNTPWAGDTNNKLYLQSGQFTATLKTSKDIGGIDISCQSVSWDGFNTPWVGRNDDKLYLQSGQFTSTLKTSQNINSIEINVTGISTNNVLSRLNRLKSISIQDNIGFNDNILIRNTILMINYIDNIGLSDSIKKLSNNLRFIQDNFGLNDSKDSDLIDGLQIIDNISFSDDILINHIIHPKFSKTFDIFHTRLYRNTDIYQSSLDPFNPMGIIIKFNYTPPENYFIREEDIVFGLYIDRVYIRDFREKKIKVQLENINVSHEVEIFAHPHEGFQFIRNRITPGNKIRIVFRARDPELKDIYRHDIYWDNATGTFIAKKIGLIWPTGQIEGQKLKEGKII